MVRLALAGDADSVAAGEAALPFLLGEEIRQVGEWQLRTNAPAGGWPCEAGADKYVDTLSTCAVLDALHALPKSSHHQSQARAAMRRAVEVLLAMQEPDGGFARFERGESEVFMTRFPLRDARLLAAGTPTDNARVRVSAAALRQLGRLGFQADDDRIARGVQWLWQRVTVDMAGFDLATLGELALCSATLCPPTHPLRQTIERQLRGRQREDGSFGSVVDTALAMHALMALEGARASRPSEPRVTWSTCWTAPRPSWHKQRCPSASAANGPRASASRRRATTRAPASAKPPSRCPCSPSAAASCRSIAQIHFVARKIP
jgi:hypothetical protein